MEMVLAIPNARRICLPFYVATGVLLLSNFAAAEPKLHPFTTDGCSMMLDGLLDDSIHWRLCCVAHDKDYWLGGTEAERRASDELLGACISEMATPLLGDWVKRNVRWGGSPYWPTTYRWGYGWPFWDGLTPRGYKELTDDEQAMVISLLPAAEALLEREMEAARKTAVPKNSPLIRD